MRRATPADFERPRGGWRRVFDTPADYAALASRLTLGCVMWAHGAQKVLGWYGGPGPEGAIAGFQQQLHLPPAIAVLVIVAEFLGGLALILGFFGRIAALGILGDMLGAILLVHGPNGLFMNWTGTQKGEGFEYHLLAIALALVVVIRGSGALSLDRWIARR